MTVVPRFVEDKPGEYRVWSEDDDTSKPAGSRYTGPVVGVWSERGWVYVSTDLYEGTARLNRETLPKLIEALQKLEAHLADTEAAAI